MKEYNRFEKARIIGARALQIARGAPPMIKIDVIKNPIEIAEKEFQEGVIPLNTKKPEIC
jgi:DNA-directed RNA polymerase subunit K